MNIETIINIVSVVLATLGILGSAFTYFVDVKRRKREATLEAYNQLQEQVFDHLNCFKPKEIEEISKHWQSSEYKEISKYLARIEHFCVGVKTNIYDIDTVYELGHGYLDKSVVNKLSCMIIKKDKVGKDNEHYYENFKWVIDKMNKKSLKKGF